MVISMKGYAIINTGEHGWIDVDEPVAGPLDAICKPLAVAPCSSDTHSMHAGIGPAGPLINRIMGHEAILELFFTSCDNFASLFLFFDKMLFDDSEMFLIKDENDVKNAKNLFNSFKSEMILQSALKYLD